MEASIRKGNSKRKYQADLALGEMVWSGPQHFSFRNLPAAFRSSKHRAEFAVMGVSASLRRAVEVGNHNYPWFQRDKNYDKLRADPEYQRIMEGVRQHWQEYRQIFGEA